MNPHRTQGFDYNDLSLTHNQTDAEVIYEGADAPDAPDPSYQLEVGTNFIGTLDQYREKDIFAVELEANQPYTIELDSYGDLESQAPTIYLRDANGYVGGSLSKVYLNESDELPTLVFTPKSSGTFYIGASAYSRGEEGDYSLTINPFDPTPEPTEPDPTEPSKPEPIPSPFNWIVEDADAPAGTTTPYKMEVGDTFEGFWSSSDDIDAVEIDLEHGHRYAFSLNSTSDSPNFGVWVTDGGSYFLPRESTPGYVEVKGYSDLYDYHIKAADLDALEAIGYTITVNEIVTKGSEADDVLHGDMLANTITTGEGNDLIRYTSKYFGNDTITDFAAGAGSEDIIEINTALFSDFDDLMSHAQDISGDSTLIAFDDGNSFLLEGVAITDLHTDDFSFV